MYKGKRTKQAVKRRANSKVSSNRHSRMHRPRRGRYSGKRNWFRIALFAVSFLVVLYASGKIVDYAAYTMTSKKHNQELAELAVQVIQQPIKTETIPEPTQETQLRQGVSDYSATVPVPETKATEPPKEKAPIIVDFKALKKHSPDIIGWLYCPDTLINYPVMRSKNNLDYIRTLPDGTPNDTGSLFLDYRNGSDFLTGYSVIYGHNMKNDTMFGTLEEYKNQEYYNSNSTMYLITEAGAYRVDLIAGVVTTGTSNYYSLPMESEFAAQKVTDAKASSSFIPSSYPDSENYLILSTCSYESDDGRFIIVGSLTEIDIA